MTDQKHKKPGAASGETRNPSHKKQLHELVAALLDSSGNQRDYLISVLLSQASPDSGNEPSLKALRDFSAPLLEQLIVQIRAGRMAPLSQVLFFFKYIGTFPVVAPEHIHTILQIVHGSENVFTPEQTELFDKIQLLHLLAEIGDYSALEKVLAGLHSDVALACPSFYAVWQMAKAKMQMQKGGLREFTSLWVNLVSDIYQTEGSESALLMILYWINNLDWGEKTAAKKILLLKFGIPLRHAENILSARLLFEIFSLEDKLVSPQEKMNYARQLFKLPSILLSFQQHQFLNFYAGNYFSGMRLNLRQSIRYYQHSNYYLHKSWIQLQSQFKFLHDNLTPTQFADAMHCLERQVMDLESQMSLQNNAYVETLYGNYDQIRELYRKVEELSVTDNLTGLKNRRYLASNLTYMFQLAARHKATICFAMLDIDLFKHVNDTHGHMAGDQVLKNLAKLLTRSFRRSDVIVRYGGEEFLLILFDAELDAVNGLMEDLRQRIKEHQFSFKGQSINITVSIGVTSESAPCLTEEALDACIERADTAMYSAKHAGRDKVVCFPRENQA